MSEDGIEVPALLSPRGKALILASALLIALGFISPQHSMFLSLFITGLSLTLLIIIMRYIIQIKAKALSSIRVERKIKGSFIEGDLHTMTLIFYNPSLIPIYGVEFIDNPPKTFKVVEGSTSGLLILPSRGTSRHEYKFKPFIGKHSFNRLKVILRDPLSLFFVETYVGEPVEYKFKPKVIPLKEKRLLSAMITAPFGTSKARIKGIGQEFADVRDYVPGDDFRHLEWKATARTGRLKVKEYELEAHLRAIFILDATKTMYYGVIGNTKLEFSARAIATIAKLLLDRGDYVGLTIYMGGDRYKIVPLGHGRIHVYRILDALADIEPYSEDKSQFPKVIAKSMVRGTSWGYNLVLLITDLEPYDEKLYNSIVDVAIKAKELRNTICIISPYSPLFELETLNGFSKVLQRIHVAKSWETREASLKIFTSRGIPVINVGPQDIIEIILKKIEALRFHAPL